MISIELSARDLEETTSRLAHVNRGLPRAIVNAINQTSAGVRTDLVKAVGQKINLPASRTRAQVVFCRATLKNPSAAVIAKDRKAPLIHFKARPSQPFRKGGRRPRIGVSAQPFKTGVRQAYPGSFVARMQSGHTGVFIRKGRRRLPIRELLGPSAADALRQGPDLGQIERKAQMRLKERFQHEVERLLRG